MPSINKNSHGSPIVLTPWIFVIVIFLLTYYAVHRINQQPFRDAGDTSQVFINAGGLDQCLAQIPSGSPNAADQIRSCLKSSTTTAQVFNENIKPDIDTLKWLLTIIAAIGGFFAIAQGAAAWFSAELYTKQAQEGLKAISDAQDAIKTRYPLFEEVESKRRQAIAWLNNVFDAASKAPDSWAGNTEALDWQDNLFRSLSVEARQLLLSVESFVSIDLDSSFNADEHADLLRKFSLFYTAKFLFEDKLGAGVFCDLERAEAYLILASQKNVDFTKMNDLASLYVTIYKFIKKHNIKDVSGEIYLDRAENVLRKSLDLDKKQQRAHNALAVINARYRKLYPEATKELRFALDLPNWQRTPSPYMKTAMYYNLSCYESRIVQNQWDKKNPVTVDQAANVLESLRKTGESSYVRTEYVIVDFAESNDAFTGDEDGDFTGLLKIACPELKKELQDLQKILDEKARAGMAVQNTKAPTAPLPIRRALVEAFRMIRTSLTKGREST